MTGAEFLVAIKTLGMSQRAGARFFEVTTTTVTRWTKEGPPSMEAVWLQFMISVKVRMHIKNVPEWINLMAGRETELRDKRKKIVP